MAMEEQNQIAIRSFSGQKSNKNSHNLEAGEAMVQVNCMSLREGELVVRSGLREQTFEVG